MKLDHMQEQRRLTGSAFLPSLRSLWGRGRGACATRARPGGESGGAGEGEGGVGGGGGEPGGGAGGGSF